MISHLNLIRFLIRYTFLMNGDMCVIINKKENKSSISNPKVEKIIFPCDILKLIEFVMVNKSFKSL